MIHTELNLCFLFLGIAPFVPYLSSYARQLGFSSVTVGIIYTIIPIFGMIAKPLLGIFSDKYKCQKSIFIGVIFLTGLSAIGFYFTPGLNIENIVNVNCDNQEYTVELHSESSCSKDQLKENGNILCTVGVIFFMFTLV